LDQSVKVKLDQGKTRSLKLGRGVTGYCLSSIVFSWYSEYLTKEALEGFRIEGQIIRSLKYADGLVLCTNEEVVPQGVVERLIDIGSCCGMETNVEETKVMRMPRQTILYTDYDRSSTAGVCGMLQLSGWHDNK